jgi:hypothetical protein
MSNTIKNVYRLQDTDQFNPTYLSCVFETKEQVKQFMEFDKMYTGYSRFSFCKTEALVKDNTCWIVSRDGEMKEFPVVSEDLLKPLAEGVTELPPEILNMFRNESFEIC